MDVFSAEAVLVEFQQQTLDQLYAHDGEPVFALESELWQTSFAEN